MKTDSDLTILLTEKNIELKGWKTARITRGIEHLPSDFELTTTEHFPNQPTTVSISPGDSCAIKIGKDLVITGYVDQVNVTVSPSEHAITVVGRGKCQDPVDCAAEWPSCQFKDASLKMIAEALLKPYGISVVVDPSAEKEAATPFPLFNFNPGETAISVIETMARIHGVLVYENTAGNLVISGLQTTKAAGVLSFKGSIDEPRIEKAGFSWSVNQRFSEIWLLDTNLKPAVDLGQIVQTTATAKDAEIIRHRIHYTNVETSDAGAVVSTKRLQWEVNRRAGRSRVLKLEVDSWRDKNGALWTPNTVLDKDLPEIKAPNTHQSPWTISEVVYRRGMDGTHCDLTVMPSFAFNVEPINYLPLAADAGAALLGQNGQDGQAK